jgi:diguanylate cyclase (GGDEF)-like protein/PAS domain S-box-containing protein
MTASKKTSKTRAVDIGTHGGRDVINAIFAKSPVAISVSRSSDGRIVDVNDRWSLLTGYAREEVLGKTSLEIGMWPSAEERERVRQAALTIQEGYSTELPFETKDGRHILIRIEGAKVEIDAESYFVVYVSDVTEERKISQAIAASERALQQVNDELTAQVELFRLTETVAMVGHWTALEGKNALHWSPGLYDLTGVPQGTTIDSTLARSMIHPDDLQRFVDARMRMDGEPLAYRAIMADGSLHYMRGRMARHVRIDGAALDYGVIQDFTDEQKAKLALQDRLNQIQLLTSRLPEMVFQFEMHSTSSGAFTFVSDAVLAIFGVSAEQAYKNPGSIFRWIYPEDMGPMVVSMNECARQGTTWAHEFGIRAADGVARTLFGKAIVKKEMSGQLFAYGSVTDITGHKASQSSLRESEERFRALTELSSDWYWEQDENFRFVRFDGAMVLKAGRTGFDSLGKTRWEVGALNMTETDWAAHRAVLESHAVFRDFELQENDYKGRPYWMSLSGAPMFDTEGNFKGYRGIGKNITERKQSDAKIERLAFYDVLTELPNRRMLVDRLQYGLATLGRDKASGALLFIDLDNFKDLNDSQGHDVGDMLLQQVAQRLLECVREVDTVARLGGDEFVVMLQGLDVDAQVATAQVEQVGKKILESLNQPYLLSALQYHSTPSIGVALFENQRQTVDELLKQADLAMYESKSAGRNTMRFFDPAMQQFVALRTAMEHELRLGLQRNELLLHYQPVMNSRGTMVGVEALVRWQHPQRGLVPPQQFIPMAEQTGLIMPLGQWVLDTACRQLLAWSEHQHTRELTIAVNVSARQFRHTEFVGELRALLARTGANPRRLKLELTESLLLTDKAEAIQKMTELGTLGVKFSLDDFGTGYSSLSYLKVLPLEQLKIDQSFVRDVLTDANDAAIARTVLALGNSLGLNVVAEGVETAGQRDFLLENGCTLFQGYFFGRPVPVDQLQLD